jgi:hypothetical protein
VVLLQALRQCPHHRGGLTVSEPVVYTSQTGWRCAYPEHIGEPVQDPKPDVEWRPGAGGLMRLHQPPVPESHQPCAKVIAALTARAEAAEADRASLYALARIPDEPGPLLPDWVVDGGLFLCGVAMLAGLVRALIWLVPIIWADAANLLAHVSGQTLGQVGAVVGLAALIGAMMALASRLSRPAPTRTPHLLRGTTPVTRALFVICPTCGAAPEQRCRAGAGPTELLVPHAVRIERARNLWGDR